MLNLLVTDACPPASSSNPTEMVEFLAESTDQVGGVLAVGGFDEMIVVVGFGRLLGAGGGHFEVKGLRNEANRGVREKASSLARKAFAVRSISMAGENGGQFVVESKRRLRSRNSHSRRIKGQLRGNERARLGEVGGGRWLLHERSCLIHTSLTNTHQVDRIHLHSPLTIRT